MQRCLFNRLHHVEVAIRKACMVGADVLFTSRAYAMWCGCAVPVLLQLMLPWPLSTACCSVTAGSRTHWLASQQR